MQGGVVVNAEGEFLADVLIKDGIIEAVHTNLKVRTSRPMHPTREAACTSAVRHVIIFALQRLRSL